MIKKFTPLHINASPEDLAGNQGIGRYILLPGSDGRANAIAEHFKNRVVKKHPRGHNLYLGTILADNKEVDVATVATGMGCPSIEIILHELFHLGGKRFLRVGTAGTLQPDSIKMGDIINVQASVRDESTTKDYAPLEIPAVASLEFLSAIANTASQLNLRDKLHIGTVHCKSSFYAREFYAGPEGKKNKIYTRKLQQCNILASEMETSALFIQSQIYNKQIKQQDKNARVLAGAILGIIAKPPTTFADQDTVTQATDSIIELALNTIKLLAQSE